MHRAYSLFEIKSVDEDQRILRGVATRPKTDRMEDIVEPMGGIYQLPMPFLMHHDVKSPVGHVTIAKPTPEGIPVEVQLKRTNEPGLVKDRLDAAWQDFKLQLVRFFSIGFNPIEWEPIKGTSGMRYKKWEWLELSGVTIPALASATIDTVKSFDYSAIKQYDTNIDTDQPAATGTAASVTPPGASGPVKALPQRPGVKRMTITEQIKQFEATRAAKAARMDELMKAAADKGETLDQAQAEEYDGLEADLEQVDKHLLRLRKQEKANAEAAKAVDATTTKSGSDSRDTRVVIKAPEKLAPGIEFARYAMCLAAAKGNVPQALALAQHHYPQQERAITVLKAAAQYGMSMRRFTEELVTKADVVAGSTTGTTWAGPLLAHNEFTGDFVEFLRAETIVGKFGQNGIPDLRRIPFNVHIKGQTSGGTGYWVGEGKPKPVTKYDFVDAYHGFTKVAAISVLTEELIRFSNPSAERLVRDALAGSLIERIDEDFIDPTITASAGVRPASVTNGVAAITSSGDDADAVRTDIQALWAAAIAANLPMTSAVYITTPSIALATSLMMNALGQREFPNMSMTGGSLLGVPVIVSNYVPAGAFILAFASEIYLSDDGQVTIDASNQASIEMLDNPTNDSVTPTDTTMVSMFQTDSVALRAHRFINWSKRRTTAVSLLLAVSWGGAES